jgi:hypothetical protein
MHCSVRALHDLRERMREGRNRPFVNIGDAAGRRAVRRAGACSCHPTLSTLHGTGWTAHAPGATPAAKRRWPRLRDEATSYEEYRDRLQSQMPDTAVRGPSKIMMVHARVDALSDYAKRTSGSVEDAAPGLPGRAGAPR